LVTIGHFPPQWAVEDIGGYFVVKASNGRPLVFIYYGEGIARRSLARFYCSARCRFSSSARLADAPNQFIHPARDDEVLPAFRGDAYSRQPHKLGNSPSPLALCTRHPLPQGGRVFVATRPAPAILVNRRSGSRPSTARVAAVRSAWDRGSLANAGSRASWRPAAEIAMPGRAASRPFSE
jgi:hypothetical protein